MVERVARAGGEIPPDGARVDVPPAEPAGAQAGRVFSARWVWLAALGAAAVGLYLCYHRLSMTTANDSDGADQVLQAWDMLRGNWLLHGWTVGDVSYYTTEIPEYILLELTRGNYGPDVLHEGAAITYTLLVLMAGLLAKGRARGRQGLVRALIAAGILLAPQLPYGVHLLLMQPDHLGTQVPLLVVFLVLDRGPRRWYIPAVVAVMLTWIIIADRIAVLDAAIPLIIVCGVRACWAIVHHGRRLSSQWFELSLMAAGVFACGAAVVAVTAIRHLGGYTSLPLPSGLAPVHFLPAHLVLTMEGILTLFGAGFAGLPPGVATVFAVLHLVGVALVLWGFCRAFRRFFSADLIVPVMATGIVLNLVAYAASVVPAGWFGTREISVVLPFGAVLAGRQLAQPLIRARLEPVLAGLLACYAIALGYAVAQPPVTDSEQPIAGWLEAHHLYVGLGTYTEANLITLDSGGEVAIRTLTWRHRDTVPRAYESEASWYDPKLSYANFVVMNSADDGVSSIPDTDILALAGPPVRTYHYRTFTVMVWNHNLLADLAGPPSPSHGDVP